MIDISTKVVKDSAKTLTAELSTNIFSVFYFIAITWLFTKLELASLSVLAVVTSLGAMFSGLGINPTLMKEIPKLIAENDRKTASAMAKSGIITHFLFSLIAASVICIFSKQISQIFFKTVEYSSIIAIISANVIVYKLYEDGEQLLAALQEFGKYSLVRVVQGIVIKILALAGYLIGGVKTYIGVVIVCEFFLFCFIIFLSRNLVRIKSGFYPIKKLLIYSLPFYGNAYSNFAAQQGDQFVIGIFLRPEQLATYYVARRFFDYLSLIIDAIMRPVGVKIAELKAYGLEKIENAIYRASRYLFFVVVPMSCFVAVSSYALLEIYGGEKYLSALPALVVLALALIPSAVYSLTVSGVYVIGEPKHTLRSEAIRGVLNLSLCLVFIGLFGIVGISIARLLSFLGASFFAYYLLGKLSKTKLDWEVFRDILPTALVASVLVISLQLVYYNILLFPLYLLLGLAIFILLFRHNLTEEDLRLIQGLLPKRYRIISNG